MAVVSHEAYMTILRLYDEWRYRKQIKWFKYKFQFFVDFSLESIATIYKNMELMDFSKGHVIYREGDEAKYIYFIKSGLVQVG